MKVALCQLDIVWEDKEANHRRVIDLLDSAALESGSLLVLPEMFSTGFSMNVSAIAERNDQPSIRFMQGLARDRGIYVIGGVVTEGTNSLGRNEAVGFAPDGTEAVRYAKIHPFQGAESRNYAGGAEIQTFECGGFRASPFVCYDLRFPEVFRMAVCSGAELFIVIANWPEKRIHHWVTLLQARAVENQAYVAGVNRCGKDPYLKYPGRSLIIDPQGRILAEADSQEQILTAKLNPESVTTWRRAFPVLKDIRCRVALPSDSSDRSDESD